jgi:hypothetical protein
MPRFFQQVPEVSTGPQAAKQAAASGSFFEEKKDMAVSMQALRDWGLGQREQDGGRGVEGGEERVVKGRRKRRRRRRRGVGTAKRSAI